MSIKRIYKESEIPADQSKGSSDTARKALKQGKPVFLGIPDGKPNDLSEILKAVEDDD